MVLAHVMVLARFMVLAVSLCYGVTTLCYGVIPCYGFNLWRMGICHTAERPWDPKD